MPIELGGNPHPMHQDRPASGEHTASLSPTHNLHVASFKSLVSPGRLKEELPIGPTSHAAVVAGREAVKAILEGRDRRFLVIVGPCSIHDVRAAMEYARRLAALRGELSDRIVLVMR